MSRFGAVQNCIYYVHTSYLAVILQAPILPTFAYQWVWPWHGVQSTVCRQYLDGFAACYVNTYEKFMQGQLVKVARTFETRVWIHARPAGEGRAHCTVETRDTCMPPYNYRPWSYRVYWQDGALHISAKRATPIFFVVILCKRWHTLNCISDIFAG